MESGALLEDGRLTPLTLSPKSSADTSDAICLHFPAPLAEDKSCLAQTYRQILIHEWSAMLCNLPVFCLPGSQVCPLNWLLWLQSLKDAALFTFIAIRKQAQRWEFTMLLLRAQLLHAALHNEFTKVRNKRDAANSCKIFCVCVSYSILLD